MRRWILAVAIGCGGGKDDERPAECEGCSLCVTVDGVSGCDDPPAECGTAFDSCDGEPDDACISVFCGDASGQTVACLDDGSGPVWSVDCDS